MANPVHRLASLAWQSGALHNWSIPEQSRATATLRFQLPFAALLAAQTAHSTEEYAGRLWESFPPARFVAGLISPDLERNFVLINIALIGFGLWCWLWPIRRGWRSARWLMWGWVTVELINGIGHPFWSLRQGGYTPGLATAPLLVLFAGILGDRLNATSGQNAGTGSSGSVKIPVALPFHFDTSQVTRLILRGALIVLLVVVVGIGYALITGNYASALPLLLSGLIGVYFGRIFLGNLVATRGSITAGEVLVEPVTLYGVRLHGPVGRFPVKNFEAVLVERISSSAFEQAGPHERVSLVGRGSTPEILIARTSNDAGGALGRNLATILGLAYREDRAPY